MEKEMSTLGNRSTSVENWSASNSIHRPRKLVGDKIMLARVL